MVGNRLLAICQPDSSTANDIWLSIKSKLDDLDVPLKHCVSFACDNANVMVGKTGGLYSFFLHENEGILLSPCICHLLNLMSKKACAELPVSIEGILIDIFYYFKHSNKRKNEFDKFQLLFGNETKRVLKHCSTRWLSLLICLQRIVELWTPLRHFMSAELVQLEATNEKKIQKKHKEKQRAETSVPADDVISSMFPKPEAEEEETLSYTHNRLIRITNFLKSKRAAVYSEFLLWFVPNVDILNKRFQTNEPLIHITNRLLKSFLRSLLSRFVKASALVNVTNLRTVNYKDPKIQQSSSEMFIGEKTQQKMDKLGNKAKLEVIATIKTFYTTAVAYVFKQFPLDNDLLINAEVADVDNRENVTWENVKFFASRLPTNGGTDNLHASFTHYKTFPLPVEVSVKDSKQQPPSRLIPVQTNQQGDTSQHSNPPSVRSDFVWHKLRLWRDFDGTYPYEDIACVMLGILSIPQSNAESERMFSIVRKNRTETRASMGIPTLESILVNKMGGGLELHESLLRKCKTATMESFKAKDK